MFWLSSTKCGGWIENLNASAAGVDAKVTVFLFRKRYASFILCWSVWHEHCSRLALLFSCCRCYWATQTSLLPAGVFQKARQISDEHVSSASYAIWHRAGRRTTLKTQISPGSRTVCTLINTLTASSWSPFLCIHCYFQFSLFAFN